MIRFGSVCSGIEAASVAWNPIGFQAAWFSEIEQFPCDLLEQKYPDIPNLGDMTALPERIASGEVEAPDILCGGTPCQAFSMAGQRGSLSDPRGRLSLCFVQIFNAIDDRRKANGQQPAVCFWENVPGVLRTGDNAFGCFLGALAGCDEPIVPEVGRFPAAGAVEGPRRRVAWRVLDAQHFGLAQRRKRVFVVASARGGADPAEILFERSRLRGDSAPRGTKPEAVAPLAPGRAGTDYRARVPVGGRNSDSNFFLRENCPTLTTDGANAGRAQGASCAVIERRSRAFVGEFDISSYEPAATASTLTTHCLRPDSRGQAAAIVEQAPPPNEWLGVRKLTPVECERLQGFPDNYTRIAFRGRSAENCPDTHRYAAVGNSWAVPVIRWLGARMKTAIEEIQ